jgi:AcrR family transcriptional regulator
MPKLKPEEVETRRQEILDAARACFLRSGFHQTTTDEICREASITPGGLYHYFGSKDEIISAVIDDAAHSTIQNLKEIADSYGDLRSAVEALTALYYEWLLDPELANVTRLDIEIWAETLRNDKLAAVTKQSRSMRRRWLEALIAQAKKEGLYRTDIDPNGLANLMMAIFDGLRVSSLLWEDEFDLEAALRSLAVMQTDRLMVEGINVAAGLPLNGPRQRAAS